MTETRPSVDSNDKDISHGVVIRKAAVGNKFLLDAQDVENPEAWISFESNDAELNTEVRR